MHVTCEILWCFRSELTTLRSSTASPGQTTPSTHVSPSNARVCGHVTAQPPQYSSKTLNLCLLREHLVRTANTDLPAQYHSRAAATAHATHTPSHMIAWRCHTHTAHLNAFPGRHTCTHSMTQLLTSCAQLDRARAPRGCVVIGMSVQHNRWQAMSHCDLLPCMFRQPSHRIASDAHLLIHSSKVMSVPAKQPPGWVAMATDRPPYSRLPIWCHSTCSKPVDAKRDS